MDRLPAALAGSAIAVKLVAIVLAESFPDASTPLVRLALQDAPSAGAAEVVVGWVFGSPCFPTAQMATAFESALLLFTGVEWYACGLVIGSLFSPGTAYPARVRASRRGTA